MADVDDRQEQKYLELSSQGLDTVYLESFFSQSRRNSSVLAIDEGYGLDQIDLDHNLDFLDDMNSNHATSDLIMTGRARKRGDECGQSQQQQMKQTSTPVESSLSSMSTAVQSPSQMHSCNVCLQSITDRYVMRIQDATFHERCLYCDVCEVRLTTSCFFSQGKFYCKNDYESRFLTKCHNCRMSIHRGDYVIRHSSTIISHVNCFSCSVCRVILRPGQMYVCHLRVDSSTSDGRQAYILCEKHWQPLQSQSSERNQMVHSVEDVSTGCPPIGDQQMNSAFEDLMPDQQIQDQAEDWQPIIQSANSAKAPSAIRAPTKQRLNTPESQSTTLSALPPINQLDNIESEPDSLLRTPPASVVDDSEPEMLAPVQATAHVMSTLGELEPAALADSHSGDEPCETASQQPKKSSREARRGPKRPRTILTACQRRRFKASFEISSKPSRKTREALASETSLSVRVVQVWFQNQRAKMKKIERRCSDASEQSKECQEAASLDCSDFTFSASQSSMTDDGGGDEIGINNQPVEGIILPSMGHKLSKSAKSSQKAGNRVGNKASSAITNIASTALKFASNDLPLVCVKDDQSMAFSDGDSDFSDRIVDENASLVDESEEEDDARTCLDLQSGRCEPESFASGLPPLNLDMLIASPQQQTLNESDEIVQTLNLQ